MIKPKQYVLWIMLLISSIVAANTPPNGKTILSGVVMDAQSKETLTGALVKIPGTQNFTYTDEQGKFSLEIPSTLIVETIEVSLVSFKAAKITPSKTAVDLLVSLEEK